MHALNARFLPDGPAGLVLPGAMNRGVSTLLDFWRIVTGEQARAEGIISRVFEDNFDGLVVIGEDGKIIAASNVAAVMLGDTSGQIAGRTAADLLPRPMQEAVEQAFVDGRRAVATPMSLATIGDPKDGGYIVQFVVTLSEFASRSGLVPQRVVNLTFWDETERRQREHELAYVGTHDRTTGAMVRREFVRQVDADLHRVGLAADGLSMVLIRLASFESLENTLGSAGIEALLRQVFTRLRAGGFETVARIDSQSFAVVRKGRLSEDKVARYCKDLLGRLSLPYPIGKHTIVVGVSIGVAHTEVSGLEAESLLSHAGMALSRAADQLPANDYALFNKAMLAKLTERRNLAPALGVARALGQMSIVYKPQCMLETGVLAGVEASIRWLHPDFGVVPPEQFMPLAEESGEVIELGRWALRTACSEVASWPLQARLAINVSAAQLALTDLVAEVQEALRLSSLPPHQLEIEVSEAPFLAKSDQIAGALKRLRALGVGITVDDFGSGYSSLGHLARLSVDKIKVAGGFVSRLPGDGEAGAVIRAVMTLAFSLEKSVLADGVETEDQAWMLQMMGCRVGQGPYFGLPLTGAELLEWHRDRSVVSAAGLKRSS